MSGLPSRSSQRQEPGWTQAPASGSRAEPVWRDSDASAGAAYQPSQVQAAAPRKSSSGKGWISAVLGVVGLLAVAYLLLSMVNVVEDQMARNQPDQTNYPQTGLSLVSTPAKAETVSPTGR